MAASILWFLCGTLDHTRGSWQIHTQISDQGCPGCDAEQNAVARLGPDEPLSSGDLEVDLL